MPIPQAAAAEISRQIEPLIELAKKNELKFLAYVLSVAAEEARCIQIGILGREETE